MTKEQNLDLQQGQSNVAAPSENPNTPPTAPKQEVAKVSKDATEVELVKLQQGLPTALQPLRDCFIAPFKTFVKCGKSIEDLQRECKFAVQLMLNNPYLITCATNNPQQFVAALENVVLTGMTLNPTLKLAYLVPYKGKVELSPSYMGKVSFAINTGLVKDIYAMLVYNGDKFTFRKGVGGTLEHEPNVWGEHKKEDILGGYYFAELSNGTYKYDVMTIQHIEDIRRRSPASGSGKSSPWDTDYEEMAKKTIINWGYKALPKLAMSDKAKEAITILNRVEDDQFHEYVQSLPKNNDDGFEETEEV